MLLHAGRLDRLALMLAVSAVPISIAVSEALLAIAIGARAVRCLRHQARIVLPRAFWFWLGWAGLEVVVWLLSPALHAGWPEVRRLCLLAGLFFVLPSLDRPADRLLAWQGVFLTSALGSLVLIADFISRLIYYRREIAVSEDISLYMRTGGLLNNWMVYGTVEILVMASLLSFWFAFPQQRRRWWPVMAVNVIAVVLSLTRMVWVCCLLMLAIELAWRRSRWLWALPLLPLAVYGLSPGVVRMRVNASAKLSYYSNAERLQMFRVGLRMIEASPLTGVGPGRVGELYRSYLAPGERAPIFHGHLHDNLFQLAAEFGLPVAFAALLFVMILFGDLWRAWKAATGPEAQFFCKTALLALVGFLVAGVFEYTYGHSLSLILLGFAVLPPLLSGAGLSEPASQAT